MDLDVIKPCAGEIVREWGGLENGLEKIQSLLYLNLLIPLSHLRNRASEPFGSGFLDKGRVEYNCLVLKKNCSWMPPGHRLWP